MVDILTRWGRAAAIILTSLVFLTFVALTAFFFVPGKTGQYLSGGPSLLSSSKTPTRILPAQWIEQAIWILTFVYNGLWLLYALSTLWRRTPLGGRLYYSPPYLSTITLLCLAGSSILGVVWIFFGSDQKMWERFIFFLVKLLILSLSVFAAQYVLRQHKVALVRAGRKREIVWTEILVQNGLGMYVAWMALQMWISLSAAMVYAQGFAMETSCLVALGLIASTLVVDSILDNVFQYEQRKRLYSEVLTYHAALIGMLINNYRQGETVTIVTFAVLALAAILLVIKITYHCSKSRRKEKKMVGLTVQKRAERPIVVFSN